MPPSPMQRPDPDSEPDPQESAQPSAAADASDAGFGTGVRWGVVDQVVQVVVRFGVMIVLARLVAPHAFGVMAAPVVVITLGLIPPGLGLGPALVQRRPLVDEHVTTAFTASAGFGVVLWGLVTVLAFPAATFFHEDQLRR